MHLNPLGALMLKASVFRVFKTQRETHEAIHKGLCTHLNKHTCRYMCMCAHTAASLWDTILICKIWISAGAFLQWTVLYSNGFSLIWVQLFNYSTLWSCLMPAKKTTKEKLIQQCLEFPPLGPPTHFSHMVFCVIELSLQHQFLPFTLLWVYKGHCKEFKRKQNLQLINNKWVSLVHRKQSVAWIM